VIKRIKVTTVLGTRPEIIRLSKILKDFDRVFDHRLIHTGQNVDNELSKIFFDELDIRTPDLFLQTQPNSLGKFLSKLFAEIENELLANRPDAVVILGDTNSALSGIIAKRMGIPVYHLEAGNRSFDQNVPEEINRKIIDHFADYNLAYTQHAKNNLLREGLHPQFITVVGSPLNEVLTEYKQRILESKILENLQVENQNYFLVSVHRQENVDNLDRLTMLFESFNDLADVYKLPIIISTHPRTKDKISSSKLKLSKFIQLHPPFGFLDYNKLQLNARLVLSDSGSISEESAILGFPAITIRDSMERPEALEAGSIIMSGIEKYGIQAAVKGLEYLGARHDLPESYEISDTSSRVLKFILSTVNSHRFRSGLRDI
jgi:UDP-N-acetylglucosamine 2-epimerase (non-hydrolysing)